jgi:hypothetical protein
VLDAVVRQDGPELVLDELRHLFSEEVGVLSGGAVATPVNKGVKVLGGPRFGGGVDGHTLVPPIAEELGGGMIDIFQFGREVGAASEGGDEVLPGRGILER